MKVAGAEAATAKLIAQMTESSPERDDAAGHQPQQQHSSDRENVPQQQYTGKRSNNVQMAAAQAVAQRQPSKRRKVSDAEGSIAASVQQAAAHRDQDVTGMEEARQVLCPVADRALNNRASGELVDVHRGGEALEPEEVVGRAVQQQFEEGLFKVNQCASPSDIADLVLWLQIAGCEVQVVMYNVPVHPRHVRP